MKKKYRFVLAVATLSLTLAATASAQDDQAAELARKLPLPISSSSLTRWAEIFDLPHGKPLCRWR